MKNRILLLDDDENEEFSIGLIRSVVRMEAHELFYHINLLNEKIKFSRQDDFCIEDDFCIFKHLVFSTYHPELKCKIHIISNKSIDKIEKKNIQGSLFYESINVNYLLPFHKDVDYLVKISDNIADFSVFLLPEKLLFQIQRFVLEPTHELYHIIQNYE